MTRIVGLHCGSVHDGYDSTGAPLFEHAPGPLCFTEGIGANPADHSGGDYTQYTERGFLPLIRLNNGYGDAGTIPPTAQYVDGSTRAANYVAASQPKGLTWVIGNEMNFTTVEAPGGVAIQPGDYAIYFYLCYNKIKAVDPAATVLVGAVAPWNDMVKYPTNERGDWVRYLTDILGEVNHYDGVCVHTYTHGHDPTLITVDRPMGEPFPDRQYELGAYQDMALAVPEGTLLYLTETNPGADPAQMYWLDVDNGWCVGVAREIGQWNDTHPERPVVAVCFYRYPVIDSWAMANKPGVLKDFRNAIDLNIEWDGGEDPPGGGDLTWQTVFETSMGAFYDYQGIGEVTVPVNSVPVWEWDSADGALDRPEYDSKIDPQPEVHTKPMSAGFFGMYSTMRAGIAWEIEAPPGTLVRASIWAMGVDGGGEVAQILGIATSNPGEGAAAPGALDSATNYWGDDWWAANMAEWAEREWQQISTPEVVTTGDRFWVIARGQSKWAQPAHTHWDDLVVEIDSDAPVEPPVDPPPTGMYTVRVHDPSGVVVSESTFPAGTDNAAEIQTHAEAIIALT